jgi:hypothetical protein
VTNPEALAVADLAAYTGIDPAEIVVVAHEQVTWRNGSLGCPKPGDSYVAPALSMPRLTGRDGELTALLAVLGDAPAVVLVEGEGRCAALSTDEELLQPVTRLVPAMVAFGLVAARRDLEASTATPRVTATDVNGSKVEQTLIRAYAVR